MANNPNLGDMNQIADAIREASASRRPRMTVKTLGEFNKWAEDNKLTFEQVAHLKIIVVHMEALGCDLSECYEAAVNFFRSISNAS